MDIFGITAVRAKVAVPEIHFRIYDQSGGRIAETIAHAFDAKRPLRDLDVADIVAKRHGIPLRIASGHFQGDVVRAVDGGTAGQIPAMVAAQGYISGQIEVEHLTVKIAAAIV